MKIVIFDMDGTLIDSQQDITRSINHVRDVHYNLEPLEAKYVVEIINQPVRNLAKLFYNTEEYDSAAREIFELHYNRQCIESIYLYDGIVEMIESLKAKEYKLSIATNAPTPFAKKMVEHLEIAHHFDHIIGADAVSNSKPSPDMLELILERYGYDRELHSAWMVGDSPNDMLAAKNAKIEPIFAAWGFSPENEEEVVILKPEDIFLYM